MSISRRHNIEKGHMVGFLVLEDTFYHFFITPEAIRCRDSDCSTTDDKPRVSYTKEEECKCVLLSFIFGATGLLINQPMRLNVTTFCSDCKFLYTYMHTATLSMIL